MKALQIEGLVSKHRVEGEDVYIIHPQRIGCPPFSGFVWFGGWFYVNEPVFLLMQIVCFFFGHKMSAQRVVYDPVHGESIEYACDVCGQVMYSGLAPQDIRATAALPKRFRVLHEIEGREGDE